MAGENTIVVSQYPDQFQTLSVVVTGINSTLGDVDDYVLYYAERDTVVDSVFFITADADSTDTFQLKRLDAAATDPDSAGTAFTNATIMNAAYTPTDAGVIVTENYIPAGSMIALNTEAGGSGDEHATVTVVIRFRTRLK